MCLSDELRHARPHREYLKRAPGAAQCWAAKINASGTGTRATQSRQPRQVRKEATVTGSCVCSEHLGAWLLFLYTSWSSGDFSVDPARPRKNQRTRHLRPTASTHEPRLGKNGRHQ